MEETDPEFSSMPDTGNSWPERMQQAANESVPEDDESVHDGYVPGAQTVGDLPFTEEDVRLEEGFRQLSRAYASSSNYKDWPSVSGQMQTPPSSTRIFTSKMSPVLKFNTQLEFRRPALDGMDSRRPLPTGNGYSGGVGLMSPRGVPAVRSVDALPPSPNEFAVLFGVMVSGR